MGSGLFDWGNPSVDSASTYPRPAVAYLAWCVRDSRVPSLVVVWAWQQRAGLRDPIAYAVEASLTDPDGPAWWQAK